MSFSVMVRFCGVELLPNKEFFKVKSHGYLSPRLNVLGGFDCTSVSDHQGWKTKLYPLTS